MVLSLDLNSVFVPKTISEYLEDLPRIEDGPQKLSKIDYYVKELEDEIRKVEAFKRELPLCMLLLNDAVVRLKQQAMNYKEKKDQAVVDDFVPLKLNYCEDKVADLENESDSRDMKSWMSSVQLWSSNKNNSHCDKQGTLSEQKQKSEEDDDRSTCDNPIHLIRGSGAFVRFQSMSGSGFEGGERKEEKEVVSQVTGLSLRPPAFDLGSPNLTTKSNENNPVKIQNKSHNHHQQLQQQAYRKQRRCWSPELHRRFVDALQQLGGSQVATPKQIRELMQVDGLTNDEVKSHLQKYRLHVRKLPADSTAAANALFVEQDQYSNQSKQSGSPQGPLRANETAVGNSSTGDDSMELEHEEKSESTHSWNGDGGHHRAGEVDV